MNKPRVTAIVQARMGSNRLPLKSMLCLRGFPIVDWVATRLRKSSELDNIIFAIPDSPLDSVLAEHLKNKDIPFYQGSEDDVLDRFNKAAQHARADLVVRVCADNPLVSPEAVDSLIRFFRREQPDYAYNHIPRGNLWPDGFGAEIVSRDTLEYLDTNACLPSQREHCFNYIWDNPGQWKIATFDPGETWLQRPDLKLDIDSPADFLKLALLPLHPDMNMREIIGAYDHTNKGFVQSKRPSHTHPNLKE